MKVLVNVLFKNSYWYFLRSKKNSSYAHKKGSCSSQRLLYQIFIEQLRPLCGSPLQDLKETAASLREQ